MTQHSDDAPFFERPLEGETSHQFQAFAVYRDLGVVRSLKKAAESFYADGGPGYPGDAEGIPEAGGGARLSRFKEWSRQHSWVARVEAFDAEEARRRSLEMQQRRTDMIEKHLLLVALGTNVLAKTLHEVARDEAYFPPGGLPALMREVTSLHRLTLGEATERVETGDPDAAEPRLNLDVLEDHEIDQMDELMRKAAHPTPEALKRAEKRQARRARRAAERGW